MKQATKKLQWFPFFPYDWINDTRQLSAQAKGCWIDILSFMWNAPIRGKWEGTYEEFARVTGIPWESATSIILELGSVSLVTKRDTVVMLINRRMWKEGKRYKDHAKRQVEYRMRQRSDAPVTNKTLDSRRKTLDLQDVKENYPEGKLLNSSAVSLTSRSLTPEEANGFKRNFSEMTDLEKAKLAEANEIEFQKIKEWSKQNGSTHSASIPVADVRSFGAAKTQGLRKIVWTKTGRLGNMPDV